MCTIMSSRYITVEEIRSLKDAVEDKRGIELLKAIRDNVVNASDVKEHKQVEGKSKEEQAKELERVSQERSFIGFTKEEELIKGEDDEGKRGILQRLEEKGLIQSGGFIPLGKSLIKSYKLTNEGYVLLDFIQTVKGECKAVAAAPQHQQRDERQHEREKLRTHR